MNAQQTDACAQTEGPDGVAQFMAGFLVLLYSLFLPLSSALSGDSMNKTNRLIHEKSPYLLQHARNPVDWYPWGEEVFKRAEKEDKPVFLSIGYSTCHWCHVMAHESFENPEIAALLNKWFICIKVDREERPDIDQMYMAATQAMNGSGGWPLSVFLFPDGRPFWAATYIPPKAQYGRPGFPDILEAVHKAWTDRRDELETSAAGLISTLQGEHRQPVSAVQAYVGQRAYDSLVLTFDKKHGGFGSAPKFPRPVVIDFLFRYWFDTGEKTARDMALSTLDTMARGGIYDQLGGGFHRYSVDGQWRVPHFEKMLYDQSQLAEVYLDAFQITGDKQYGRTARSIFSYVLRDMRSPEGGFYSAEDADSDDPYQPGKHGEGAFYLWTEEDIVQTLGARDADIFNYCHGVRFEGNAPADPQKEFTGRNILYLRHSAAEAAEKFDLPVEKVEAVLESSRFKLFTKRAQRIRPHLDDKILTSWNGLMIGALARGGAVLQDPGLTAAAVQAAEFIETNLYDPKSKTLLRRWRQGEAGIPGQLDDYAFLVSGLLKLYQAQQNPRWLQWVMDLTQTQVRLFYDSNGGGFYDSLADPTVVVRMKGDYDGAEPAANSVAAENLVRLGRLTGNSEWMELAGQTVNGFASRINHFPQALVRMVNVYQDLAAKPRQVVVAGRRGNAETREMLNTVSATYDPGLMLLLADGAENQDFLSAFLPFIRTVVMIDGRATAYVCENFTCRLPVTSVNALAGQLGRDAVGLAFGIKE